MQIGPILKKCDQPCARRVALWGVGLGGSKKDRKMKVLRMRSSIVENVPTPQESLLELFPASQLPYRAKIQKMFEILKLRIFPYFLYQPALELFPINET